jgi:hypothetical protein
MVYSFSVPGRSIENSIEREMAPDQDVFAALAEAAIKPPIGDPEVDRFDRQPEQVRQLLRTQDHGVHRANLTLEGAVDFRSSQFRALGHREVPSMRWCGSEAQSRLVTSIKTKTREARWSASIDALRPPLEGPNPWMPGAVGTISLDVEPQQGRLYQRLFS